MRSLILSVAFSFFIGGGLLITGCHTPKKLGVLQVSSDNPANLGSILQFTSKTSTFLLVNKGNKSIVVTNLENGCGCTKSKLNKNPILAGDSAYVTVILSSERRIGPFGSTVGVYWKEIGSNQLNKINLVVQAVAVSMAIVEPVSIDLTFNEPGENAKSTTLLIRHGSGGPTWDSVVAWDGNGSLPIKAIGNTTFELPVVFDPTNKPLGLYRDAVNIQLRNAGKDVGNRFLVPVSAKVVSEVEISPGAVFLGLMKPGSSKYGTLKIVSKNGNSIHLLPVQRDQSGFQVVMEPQKSLKLASGTMELFISYEIKIPKASNDAPFKMHIEVQSNAKNYALMVPVIVYQ